MAELRPAPLHALARRAFAEHRALGAIYDLPERSFWRPSPDLDLSVTLHGERAANPVGPAAGPHTQLAQNIVLSWLAGARVLELKTVQVNDRLEIPRPCIDVRTIGYNVEWSQELRVRQSVQEYAKAWLLIHVLARADVLGIGPEASAREVGGTLFDLSVGYDLAGIRSAAVTGFIRDCMDAARLLDALADELPGALRPYVEQAPIPARMADCITLSTFHGCPANEIEDIANYLLDEIGVHVVLKLNPPLLGFDAVERIVRRDLGHGDVAIPARAFEEDLRWDDMVPMVRRLRARAAARSLSLGVKLTNTLVVRNHGDYFHVDEMYLSGQPLHVVASHLFARIREEFPELPVSFSAGVDRGNIAACAALGLAPITACTDLLRPGGYARLSKYLANLEAAMRAAGVTDLPAYVAAARAGGLTPAGYAAGLLTDGRYHAARTGKAPRKLGSELDLFDCVNCDKCLPACPNDANFHYDLPPAELRCEILVRRDGAWVREPAPPVTLAGGHQLANFADFCNECGNCDVFCPEDGGPFVMKPRFFGTREEWALWPTYDGLALDVEPRPGAPPGAGVPPGAGAVANAGAGAGAPPAGGGAVRVWGRMGLRPYVLLIDDDAGAIHVADGVTEAVLDAATFSVRHAGDAPEGHRLDLTGPAILAILARSVLDPARPNPVNAPHLSVP